MLQLSFGNLPLSSSHLIVNCVGHMAMSAPGDKLV